MATLDLGQEPVETGLDVLASECHAAARRARLPHQMTGMASSTPAGSSQRWPFRAA